MFTVEEAVGFIWLHDVAAQHKGRYITNYAFIGIAPHDIKTNLLLFNNLKKVFLCWFWESLLTSNG